MKNIIRKYHQLLLYLFFGVCTTVINTVAYGALYEALAISKDAACVELHRGSQSA